VDENPFSLEGRVAVVTGALGLLGRNHCAALARAGANVVVCDLDEAACVAAAAALSRTSAHAALGGRLDVTAPDAIRALRDRILREFGRIDVLVNNAGLSHRSGLAQTAPAVIRKVVEVNFFGAVHCTQAALPHLLASRGLIVVISSVAGFAPLIARTGYAASKHALHGFFDSLRSELAPEGVGVTLVCPSFVDTGIERHALGADGGPARHARTVTGERATPEAVADQVYLAASKRQRLLLVGRTARLAWWVSRIAPATYERMMAKRLRAELDAARR